MGPSALNGPGTAPTAHRRPFNGPDDPNDPDGPDGPRWPLMVPDTPRFSLMAPTAPDGSFKKIWLILSYHQKNHHFALKKFIIVFFLIK